MTVILRLFRLVTGGCRHSHMYRERRELHGTLVLHWVCEDCGHAVPAIQRTPSEHQRVVEQGAIRPPHVQRIPVESADVVGIGTRRRVRPRETWRRASSE